MEESSSVLAACLREFHPLQSKDPNLASSSLKPLMDKPQKIIKAISKQSSTIHSRPEESKRLLKKTTFEKEIKEKVAAKGKVKDKGRAKELLSSPLFNQYIKSLYHPMIKLSTLELLETKEFLRANSQYLSSDF